MNHQSDFFEECTKKRDYKGNDDEDAHKRKENVIAKAKDHRLKTKS